MKKVITLSSMCMIIFCCLALTSHILNVSSCSLFFQCLCQIGSFWGYSQILLWSHGERLSGDYELLHHSQAPDFIHAWKIKSGSGLGMRLTATVTTTNTAIFSLQHSREILKLKNPHLVWFYIKYNVEWIQLKTCTLLIHLKLYNLPHSWKMESTTFSVEIIIMGTTCTQQVQALHL